ncbi:methenyltetrahydrofolate synthase domain-containing protein isoform X1 [Piliocolobus tephrosceles]|uniref:methenyltetrahydrofolate synthase domain-containing protein isoform X1 n=1 Tax=Piliocolobus tephrosceles TaxID=591936 RepID=UPI000C2A0B60|nr:methenyltetrahydrofolate synthase domain-containing protein isoform X1 [Piliocolobus tephrosceles]
MSRGDCVAMEPRAVGVSKQDIREQIWDHMESQNLADFPRPVHHRIPNFKGSYLACQNIKDLDVFARTQEVKVDPDKPLEGVRLLALQSKKTLLVPTPRLRTGLFNKITPPPGATKDILRKCATSQGVRNCSVPIGLDSRVLVDLVVVGSVAVSEKGWRIGKGEGYADLEYAMMVSMGAVSNETPVVTIVHDCQVVDIPEELLEEHDITVDYILTPTRVIATDCKRPQPMGITWSKGVTPDSCPLSGEETPVVLLKSSSHPKAQISRKMMEKIPVLRSLRAREQQAGKDVTLQGERQHLPEPGRQQAVPLSAGRRPLDTPGPEANSMEATVGSPPGEGAPLAADVYVGNLPRDARVSDLKRALRELGSVPLRLTWQGPRRRAFLHYPDSAAAQQAVSCLQGLRLGTDTLRVALARQQRDK